VRAVFVYGTLMPGGPAWDVLAPFAVASEPATASGRLFDTGAGFPAAVFTAGDTIEGAYVTLAPDRRAEAWNKLDRYEGAGTLYRRVAITTSAGPAHSYEWLGPTDRLRRLGARWS
jgi:gamma-glutamylcyclotransferase (GGCT)/AIG2-like uncharacterized protein YtfP